MIKTSKTMADEYERSIEEAAIRRSRLRRAAPELLEALQRVMAYLSLHDQGYSESNADAIKARAAIAAATEPSPFEVARAKATT